MPRRILITGGAGFIGSHVAERLLEEGDEVHVLDDLSTGSLANIASLIKHPRFRFTQGSILNHAAVSQAMKSVDLVYHLAAAVGVSRIMSAPIETIQCNASGTENVLKAAATEGSSVLITSTSEVYGQGMTRELREDDNLSIRPPTSRRWGYACSKLLDEFLAMAYWREKNLPVFLVRLFNVVGPRQSGHYGMVLPRFIDQALNHKPITVYGDGSQSRCFCHVDDVVHALCKLPLKPEATGQIYNIGSTEEISILELALLVKRLLGSRSELRFIPYELAYSNDFEDISRRIPCTKKISKLLGWQPRRKMIEILESLATPLRNRSLATADPFKGSTHKPRTHVQAWPSTSDPALPRQTPPPTQRIL